MTENVMTQPTPHSRVPNVEKPKIAPFSFTGDRGQLFSLAFSIGVLNVLTLGFYRFWGKTRLRRYFWQNIRIGREPLEYTGTGGELFKGFLVAIVILMILGTIYSFISAFAQTEGFGAFVLVEVGYYVVLLGLIQLAFYRLWRYRLSRTSWRSIRFSLGGSSMTYLWKAMGWWLVNFLTLGLATPWASADLWRYRMNNTAFGSLPFAFAGRGKELLGPWLTASLLPMCGLVAFYAVNMEFFAELQTADLDDDGGWSVDLQTDPEAVWLLGVIPIFFLTYLWYQVIELRYVLSRTDIGPVRLSAAFSVWHVLGVIVLGWAITLGVFGMAFLIMDGGAVLAGAILVMMSMLFLLPVLNVVIVEYGMTKIIASGMYVSDPEALDAVLQSTGQGPGRGEGFADALDVGGF